MDSNITYIVGGIALLFLGLFFLSLINKDTYKSNKNNKEIIKRSKVHRSEIIVILDKYSI